MTSRPSRTVLRLLPFLLAFVLAIGFVALIEQLDLNPFGLRSQNHDSQVVDSIKRTQEVSLLSLGIQGIDEGDQEGTVFGTHIPGTTKKLFIEYKFKAKLGIDGAQVKVAKTGENAFTISVPAFKFIGYDEPTFKVAAADGGVLSWTTPDIDQTKMVNKIFSSAARQKYITENDNILREQTKAFYNGLITSVEPAATVKFEFTNR